MAGPGEGETILAPLTRRFAAPSPFGRGILVGVLRPALVLLLAFLIFGSDILAYQAIRTVQR